MSKNSQHQKGYENEVLVILYYQNLGYELLAHRFKTPFAEIDLLMKKKDKVIMVEVKSISHENWIIDRISKSQKLRIHRAFIWLLEKYSQLEFHFVVVSRNGKIQQIDTGLY